MIKDAVILAGGFGTRLQGLVKDVPKPMAMVNGKPFLEYLLIKLQDSGIKRVVISVGYKYESIVDYFGYRFQKMQLIYTLEDTPLGTGGAICLAIKETRGQNVLVLNGDTFFDVDIPALMKYHLSEEADVTLALKSMNNPQRYGTVELEYQRITLFREKSKILSKGLINGGVYALKKKLLYDKNIGEKFSFEKDFLEKEVYKLYLCAFPSDAYFIDIGIPADYLKANEDFKNR